MPAAPQPTSPPTAAAAPPGAAAPGPGSGTGSAGPHGAAAPAHRVEVIVSAEAFAARVLAATGPVVVDFCADWCGPSRAFGPTFEALAQRYGAALHFVRVDTVAAPELARQQAVRSVPTLSVYRHGQPVKTVVGPRPEAEIDRMLRRLARSLGPRLGLALRWRRGAHGPPST